MNQQVLPQKDVISSRLRKIDIQNLSEPGQSYSTVLLPTSIALNLLGASVA